MRRVVALAGPLCSGKTSVAELLSTNLGLEVLSARALLFGLAGTSDLDRRALQEFGAEVEARTGGMWLVEAVKSSSVAYGGLLVDAIRTRAQAIGLLETGATIAHLTAPVEVLRARFEDMARGSEFEPDSFDLAMSHQTEAGADGIRDLAHLVVHTEDVDAARVAATIAAYCGFV